MNYLKSLTIAAIALLLMYLYPFYCTAEDIVWDEGKKVDVFKKAKEQDRFVLTVIGTYSCGWCNQVKNWLNGSLRKIVDDNYYPWFVFQDAEIYQTIKNYTAEYDALVETVGKARPIILIVNPNETDDDFILFWPPESRSEQILRQKITPPSLLSYSDLNWYENRNDVYKSAKEQGKYILKLVGRATSPNSNEVIKLLNKSPLKEMLGESYALWYSSDVSEANLDGDAGIRTLPYISIIDPEEQDILLEEEWGALKKEALEKMLIKYAVSNDKILTQNKAFISGNVLHISNQTGNEQIRVYSVTGQSIATIRKNDFNVSIDASGFPKGVFIIHSSAGWSAKVINQ